MQNKDYILSTIYRKLDFPMQIFRVSEYPLNNYRLDKKILAFHFISFVWKLEQSAVLEVNGKKTLLNAPYLAILNADDEVSLTPNSLRDETYVSYQVCQYPGNVFNLKSCFFRLTPKLEAMRRELNNMLEKLHSPGNVDRIDNIIIQMAYEAMLNRLDDRLHKSDELPDDRIFKVSRRIEMYYDTDLDIDREISQSGLSKRCFYREWSKYFTQPPKSYLMGLRFNKACSLLQNSELTIAEIADNCGFATAAYFARIFREHYKLTPGEYRKKNINQL